MNKVFNNKEDFVNFISIDLEHYLPTRIKHLLIRHTDEIGLMINYRYNNISYFLKFPFTFDEFKDVVYKKHICQMKSMGEWGERKLQEGLDKYMKEELTTPYYKEEEPNVPDYSGPLFWAVMLATLNGFFFVDSHGNIKYATTSMIDVNFYYNVLKINYQNNVTICKFEDFNKTWGVDKNVLERC